MRVQAAHLKASSGRQAVQQGAQEAGTLQSASNNTECQARHAVYTALMESASTRAEGRQWHHTLLGRAVLPSLRSLQLTKTRMQSMSHVTTQAWRHSALGTGSLVSVQTQGLSQTEDLLRILTVRQAHPGPG